MSRTNTIRVLMLSMSVFSLAACGGGDSRPTKSAAPMPPITEMDAAMNETTPPPQPLPLSESDTLTPVMPVAASPATTTVSTTTTTSAAAPTTAPSASMETRMAVLEQSVNSLRSDYNRIMPAFASLNTTNERIQVLLDEMEADGRAPAGTSPRPLSAPPAAATTTAIPAPGTVSTRPVETLTETTVTETVVEETKPAVTTPSPAQTAPVATSNTVTGVRIGEHGSKTRIVLDLTAKSKPDFKYDLDNAEKILIVEMPASAWSAAQGGKPNSPLIAGWTSGAGTNGGSAVTIQLKKDARILSTEYLKAEGKDPARLVIDIAPAK